MHACRAIFLSFSLLPGLFAADPPADVDAALRERVQTFYQLHVDHKFRQAEAFVAEDSKDFYYEEKKPDLKEFRITRIEYAPDFNSAKVSLSSRTEVLLPGAGPVVLDLPFFTNWKIEDGKWCWYIDKDALLQTPFGKLKPDGSKKPPDIAHPVAPSAVMSAVQADREQVVLDPTHPQSVSVGLKNTLPGPVSLRTFTESNWLKIEFAKTNLSANESTTLTLTPAEGTTRERPPSVVINVQPMNQIVTIAIDWVN